MGRSRRKPAKSAPWMWPAALVVSVGLLVFFGRDIVVGLFTVLLVAFGLAVVLLVVTLLVSMTRPGPRGALHHLPRNVGEVRALVRATWLTLSTGLRQAPWRSPRTVIARAADRVGDEVAVLPSGPRAYAHLQVGLHPQTLRAVDAWMPVEEVAWLLAEHYAAHNGSLPRMDPTVTVTIAEDPDAARGRVRVIGSFRTPGPGPDLWATSRCPYDGPEPAAPGSGARGTDAVLRLHDDTGPDIVLTDPPAPGPLPSDGDPFGQPGDTQRLPAAGPRRSTATDTTLVSAALPDSLRTSVATRAPAVRPIPLTLIPIDRGHPTDGARPTFTEGPVIVGRGLGATLLIDDPYVSREHATLSPGSAGWTIMDTDSTHGTYLNGVALIPGSPRPLADGDVVAFGRHTPSQATAFTVSMVRGG